MRGLQSRIGCLGRPLYSCSCALALLAGARAADAEGEIIIHQEVVPITPLARLAVGPGTQTGAAQDIGIVTLPLPSGNVTDFGAAVATMTDGVFDYVVVGAPGAGRAFVYKKALSSDSFDAPQELTRPDSTGSFGSSVSIAWGAIAVGGGLGGGYGYRGLPTYSQDRDAQGYPIATSSFRLDYYGGPVPDRRGHWKAVTLARGGGVLVACDGYCEEFYAQHSVVGGATIVSWSPIGGRDHLNGESARILAGAMVLQGLDNTLGVHNAFDYQLGFESNPSFVFGLTGQDNFNGGVAGYVDLFLAGVTAPGTGSRLYPYVRDFSGNWARQAGPPVVTLVDDSVGTTIEENTDTWLLSNTSNTSPASPSAVGKVYRVKLDRAGTYYDYSDDIWTQELLASGGPRFGAGLAVGPDFLAIGDPGTNTVQLIGNDQQIVRSTYRSGGTPAVTVTITTLQGAAPPTLHVDPTCTDVPGSMLLSSTNGGDCVRVTPNAPLIGSSRVCYENSTFNEQLTIFRCTSPLPTVPASCSFPDYLYLGKCCSRLPNQLPGVNPLCGDTSHFSSVALGIPRDTDSDFVPDYADNCPAISEPATG